MKGPIASIFEATINKFLPASTDDDIYEVSIKGKVVLSYDEALDSKENRSVLALGAGLVCLLLSGLVTGVNDRKIAASPVGEPGALAGPRSYSSQPNVRGWLFGSVPLPHSSKGVDLGIV